MNHLLDSCKTLIFNQSSEINNKQFKLFDLEQKLTEEKNHSIEKSNQISKLKQEIELHKIDKSVDVHFKFEVIQEAENQDARVGTNTKPLTR